MKAVKNPESFPGGQIGGYKLLKKIGEGGMGKVYQALHLSLDRIVALKVLPEKTDSNALERFKLEARATAKLRHPNIVTLYNFEEEDKHSYIVMDFIDGCSLEDYLKQYKLSPAKACRLMIPVLQAIEYAHNNGFIHRDIKPANILINKQHTPFVTDFGLVKAIEEPKSGLSQTGAIIGTPAYMSPEQAAASPDDPVDVRSDIYSLGAMFYEMLAGRPPIEGKNIYMILHKLATHQIVPPSVHRRLPRELDAICMKALAKEKHARYQNVAAFRAEIEKYLGQAASRNTRITTAPNIASSANSTQSELQSPKSSSSSSANKSGISSVNVNKSGSFRRSQMTMRIERQQAKKNAFKKWVGPLAMMALGFVLALFLLEQSRSSPNNPEGLAGHEKPVSVTKQQEKTVKKEEKKVAALATKENEPAKEPESGKERKTFLALSPQDKKTQEAEKEYQLLRLRMDENQWLENWRLLENFRDSYPQTPTAKHVASEQKEIVAKVAWKLQQTLSKIQLAIKKKRVEEVEEIWQETQLDFNTLQRIARHTPKINQLLTKIAKSRETTEHFLTTQQQWHKFLASSFPTLLQERKFSALAKELKVFYHTFQREAKKHSQQTVFPDLFVSCASQVTETYQDLKKIREIFTRFMPAKVRRFEQREQWVGFTLLNHKTISGQIIKVSSKSFVIKRFAQETQIPFVHLHSDGILDHLGTGNDPVLFSVALLLYYEGRWEKSYELAKRISQNWPGVAKLIERLEQQLPKDYFQKREQQQQSQTDKQQQKEPPQEQKQKEQQPEEDPLFTAKETFHECLLAVEQERWQDFFDNCVAGLREKPEALQQEKEILKAFVSMLQKSLILDRELIDAKQAGKELLYLRLRVKLMQHRYPFWMKREDGQWKYGGSQHGFLQKVIDHLRKYLKEEEDEEDEFDENVPPPELELNDRNIRDERPRPPRNDDRRGGNNGPRGGRR